MQTEEQLRQRLIEVEAQRNKLSKEDDKLWIEAKVIEDILQTELPKKTKKSTKLYQPIEKTKQEFLEFLKQGPMTMKHLSEETNRSKSNTILILTKLRNDGKVVKNGKEYSLKSGFFN